MFTRTKSGPSPGSVVSDTARTGVPRAIDWTHMSRLSITKPLTPDPRNRPFANSSQVSGNGISRSILSAISAASIACRRSGTTTYRNPSAATLIRSVVLPIRRPRA